MDISDITEQQIIDLIEIDNQDLIDIPNFPNYKLNKKTNQIYNLKTHKYLPQHLRANGSYRITLTINRKRNYYSIDRLIYSAYNPTDDISFSEVEHLDNDLGNNNIDNLKVIITDKNDMLDIANCPDYKLNKKTNKVFSLKTIKYLKTQLDKDGYYLVYLYNEIKNSNYRLHRIVYSAHNPTEDISLLQIDHIDNNKTNNNIDNLRTATNSQNSANTKTQKNNKLGYKNISRTKSNTFSITIEKNKITYNKTLLTLEEAIIWRDNKQKELFGEFANSGK